MDEVNLNQKTVNTLQQINHSIAMLQQQANAIIQTYCDALDLEGNYQINQDMTKLVLIPDKEE